MYETILVPTDGSDGATAAARHGLTLAAAFDARIHFLSVVDERSYSSALADLDPAVDDRWTALERRAQEAVAHLESLAADRSVPCRTAVERGVPHEAIGAYVADHGVDLVSMGTHGRTGLDRLLLGSVTERVVRTSEVPVLTCHLDAADATEYDRVLVPTDASEGAAAATAHGIAIAERFDATVHALSVVDTDALVGPYPRDPEDVYRAMERGCRKAVAEVRRRCEEGGVGVVTAVTEGTPHHAIRNYVDDEGIDLIAMGTHGRTGLARYLIGSVAERVLRTSEVPVIAAR